MGDWQQLDHGLRCRAWLRILVKNRFAVRVIQEMVGKTNEIKRSPGSYSVDIPPKHIKNVDFPTDYFRPEVELYSSSREINGRADIVEAVSDSVIRVRPIKRVVATISHIRTPKL
ncbi:MAG: hypothetical protein VB913_06225 [Rhodospirillales bacterium]